MDGLTNTAASQVAVQMFVHALRIKSRINEAANEATLNYICLQLSCLTQLSTNWYFFPCFPVQLKTLLMYATGLVSPSIQHLL